MIAPGPCADQRLGGSRHVVVRNETIDSLPLATALSWVKLEPCEFQQGCWSLALRAGILEEPVDTTNARHHDLEDATVDLTSYRSDLVSLPENLCECPMINDIIDAEERVARKGHQERMLCDPLGA